MTFCWFSIFCLMSLGAWSYPCNPLILVGEVSCEQAEGRILVHASDGAVIQWQDFSVDPGEVVEFIQPGMGATVENRAEGNPSRIRGSLSAQGCLTVVNPDGILIGSEAKIQAPSFFVSAPSGLLVNQGDIQGEEIQLLAYEVQNGGRVNGSEVRLAGSGEKIAALTRFDALKTLDMPGSTVIHVGGICAERVYVSGEYIDLRAGSTIYGKNILIGEGEKNARIVKIDGEIEGESIQAFSDAALKGAGRIVGRLEIRAPLLLDFAQ